MPKPDLTRRTSGLLLHPTSLPGPHGNGDLGPEAYAFARWLARTGQSWWLMLPVGPVGYGNSPYSALSAFAGSPLLIAPEGLRADGLLRSVASARPTRSDAERVDYAAAAAHRSRLHRAAFAQFQTLPVRSALRGDLNAFRERERSWLPDFTLYMAIKSSQGLKAWTTWPAALRDRKPAALREATASLDQEVSFHEFEQWQFDRQWRRLREHCATLGVGLMGDVPIFVAHDSADVWSHRELFRLDRQGRPTVVAGVPPDYFSRTGQLWGNPLYRWERLRANSYDWWIRRLRHTLTRFDAIRIDHFIGFYRFWEIPAGDPTAEHGKWKPGPRDDFFERARQALGGLPLIAEDLGAITPDVKALRDRFGLPGIRILQFAFGTDLSAPDFLPHNYPRRCVVFTGTHDNDTTVGWFTDPGGRLGTRSAAQTEKERRAACAYLRSDGREIHWDMIATASASVADLAIFPVQDLLGLGSEARMNHPGTAVGNWEWRLYRSALSPQIGRRLAAITRTYGRWPT